MECSLCKKVKLPTKDVKNPCYPCDSCRNLICIDCTELSATELKCLALSRRLLKFHCVKCRNYDFIDVLRDQIKDKDHIIQNKDEIIEMLKERITENGNKNNESENSPNSASFADVAKTKVTHTCPTIIIKPKTQQDLKKTKEDIEKNVKLEDLKVGVQNLKTTKSGAVVIKCLTKKGTELLETDIRKKLNDKYNIELSKMRKPRIKIINFKQEMDSEQIEKCIAEQNNVEGAIRVIYIKKSKFGTKTLICECCPRSFNRIMQEGKVCIGWERCKVYEDLDIPRCFNCQGYYHKKQNCSNAIVCSFCGESHVSENCHKIKKCCNNCIVSNEKYKTKYPVDHYATDPNCHSLAYLKHALRNKTIYS